MIDAFIAQKTNCGPDRIHYCFPRKKAPYHMIIQLMIWLKTKSPHEVIQQAISELYAKERNIKFAENLPKQ